MCVQPDDRLQGGREGERGRRGERERERMTESGTTATDGSKVVSLARKVR